MWTNTSVLNIPPIVKGPSIGQRLLGMLPGIGGFLGGLFGQRDANQASARMAREQMAFQERMSSTAHQREVADLRAAGFNPTFSATGGGGASSSGGAMGTGACALEVGISSAIPVCRV